MSEEGEGEEQQVIEEEIEDPDYVPPIMDAAILASSLKSMDLIADGTSYAFTEADLAGKEIESFGELLRDYIHVRDIKVQDNKLRDLSEITFLPYLETVNAQNNKIKSIEFLQDQAHTLQYLKTLDLTQNKLVQLTNIPQARICSVILNQNKISSCVGFVGHPTLTKLELRKNMLEDCEGLGNLLCLTELTLAENKIKDFSGLNKMPCLKKLDLSKNLIDDLTKLPDLPALEELELSKNKIANGECLPKFTQYPKLNFISMMETPYGEEMGDRFKNEVLVILGTQLTFKMIGEEEVTEDDLTAAKEDRDARAAAKKEAEEEAARLAAEKAAEGEAPAEEE